MMATAPPGWLRLNTGVALATARTSFMRMASNTIMLLRSPLYPLFALIGYKLVYDISGQTTIPDANVLAFLMTGLLGTMAWQSTVWGAGNAIQNEMWSGTIGSLVMAPGSLNAVIVGQALGMLIFVVPSTAIMLATGWAMGATWNLAHPFVALLGLAMVFVGCLTIGLACGGLFILSRQSNALSNFFQEPIYLLCGFYVSRDLFPAWLQRVGDVLPVTHGLDALRSTVLDGGSFVDVRESLAWFLGSCFVFAAIGIWSMGRLDRSVRRAGTLDVL